MSFHYRYRKQLIIGSILLIIIISIASFFTYQTLTKKEVKNKSKIITISKKKTSSNKKQEDIVEETYRVDIKGEINAPGIYTVKPTSRVIDVIEMAGGLTENANTTVINLSKKVLDEMVIIIYSNAQVENFKATKIEEEKVINSCRQVDENAISNDACIDSEQDKEEKDNTKVNINTASIEEFMTLSGIGEAKAKSIIEYRDSNGNFNSIEDIMNVPGIGESLFASIKENITT